jgi:hypothetical protein
VLGRSALGRWLMRDIVVMGIDPGMHSLGVCVLTNGVVSFVYQRVSTPKERKEGVKFPWADIIGQQLDIASPTVIGLEDVEPQPWKAKGRVPTGLVALQRLVVDIREMAQLRGLLVYTQSPSIQAQYSEVLVDFTIRKAMGAGFRITPHLRSALKHAWYADSMYRRAAKLNG